MPRTWRPPPEVWRNLEPLVHEHREQPTRAEAVLWRALRSNKSGLKFRRQHAVRHYIVDFYCAELGIVIEVDGPIHDRQKDADAVRQADLEADGLTFLRFTNEDVLKRLDHVMATIEQLKASS